MIILNNSSVADVKYGSRQVDKVYHGSNLVWDREEWNVEYVFPNANAYMRNDSDYGFNVAVVLNDNERVYPSPVCGFNNNDADAPGIYDTHPGYTQHYMIYLPTQFQDAIFCNIRWNHSEACLFKVYAGTINNMAQCFTSTNTNKEAWNESNFNIQPCEIVEIITSSPSTCYYVGNFYLKFKIPRSKLQAWKRQYGVS